MQDFRDENGQAINKCINIRCENLLLFYYNFGGFNHTYECCVSYNFLIKIFLAEFTDKENVILLKINSLSIYEKQKNYKF